MAKRKDLLLTEATTMRMMGLAGIGSLANPFLKEQVGGPSLPADDQEEQEEGLELESEMEEDYEQEDEGMNHMYDENLMSEEEDESLEEGYEEDESLEEGYEEDESLEEGVACKKCGKVHEGSCKGYMQENIRKSMKRLKKLLEQADLPPPAEDEEAPSAEPPPAPEGVGGDEMESKIKEFVKKLGELVQETLGVEVTVEESGEEKAPEGEAALEALPPPPAGGAEAPPPAPMAEAINRLVNKVAARVKARLMEKKDPKAAEMKAKKMKALKEKQMAAKKKEKEMAVKKKEMEMKKKKAAAMKAKKK